jgi:hypothetical protein
MDYTLNNINTLINSINDNTNAIKDMFGILCDNCSELNSKLSSCANNHTKLTDSQISAYKSYITEYEHIKHHMDASSELLSIYTPVQFLSDISSIISFCSNLLRVHHEQLKLIDRLCSVLEKSNSVIKLIA